MLMSSGLHMKAAEKTFKRAKADFALVKEHASDCDLGNVANDMFNGGQLTAELDGIYQSARNELGTGSETKEISDMYNSLLKEAMDAMRTASDTYKTCNCNKNK